jgi:hypothetical protein
MLKRNKFWGILTLFVLLFAACTTTVDDPTFPPTETVALMTTGAATAVPTPVAPPSTPTALPAYPGGPVPDAPTATTAAYPIHSDRPPTASPTAPAPSAQQQKTSICPSPAPSRP